MFDCSINGDASTEISEVEELSSSQGEICFGTVSTYLWTLRFKEAPDGSFAKFKLSYVTLKLLS